MPRPEIFLSHASTDKESVKALAVLDLGSPEHKVRLLRAIGAFGNTDKGGYIIVGISDDRQVVGLRPEIAKQFDQTNIQRMAGNHFTPPGAIQVRRHERDGKALVIIDVQPFREVPSVVSRHLDGGKEHLREGQVLVRNGAAESKVMTTETELRALCDAVAVRRARLIVE